MAVNTGNFIRNTQITEDADFQKLAFEQSIALFLEEGQTDFNNLHVEANDAIMDEISLREIDPTTVNTEQFKRASICWVLARIWGGQQQRPDDLGKQKFDRYDKCFTDQMDTQLAIIDPDAGDEEDATANMPKTTNRDSRSRLDEGGYGGWDLVR
jgi:hypothetical protein